jgi:hypothetical protein
VRSETWQSPDRGAKCAARLSLIDRFAAGWTAHWAWHVVHAKLAGDLVYRSEVKAGLHQSGLKWNRVVERGALSRGERRRIVVSPALGRGLIPPDLMRAFAFEGCDA